MSFASPAFLVGLALIPVLVVLYVRAERRPQSFAPAHAAAVGRPGAPGWRRHAAIAGYARRAGGRCSSRSPSRRPPSPSRPSRRA